MVRFIRHSLLWAWAGACAFGCSESAPPPNPLVVPVPDVTVADATIEPDAHPLKSYFQERVRLNDTIWTNEDLAQRHERVFVAIWDALRGRADPVAILSKNTATVVLPELSRRATQVPGVIEQVGAVPSMELKPEAWLAWLQKRASEGYRLKQSEWHHRKFEPSATGEHRSVVKAEFHVEKGSDRVLLRFALHVHWVAGARDPTLGRVEVHDLEILKRAGPPQFTTVAEVQLGANKPMPILVHDLGNDGAMDLIVPRRNARHRWTGEGFEKSELAPAAGGPISAATLADFTGDGVVDLLVAETIDEKIGVWLYTGNADGRFPGSGKLVFSPQDPFRRIRVLTPGDIDGDGDLDIWVAQYRGAYSGGRMPVPFYDANDGWPSYLLRNDGEQFSEITEAAGLAALRHRHTQSATFFDFDRDGDADLLTVNDFAGVDLYRNDGGRFRVDRDWLADRHLFGMSHVVADLDGDARLDLFATGMNSTTVRRLDAMGLHRPDVPDDVRWRGEMTFGNRFYSGGPRLELAKGAPDVAASGWSWGTASADLDRDGDREVVVANGFISGETAVDYCTDYWRHDVYLDNSRPAELEAELMTELIQIVESGISWNGFEHNRLFWNTGSGRFAEVGWLFGLGQEWDSRNVLATDIDGDGAVDLVVVEIHRRKLRARVLRNGSTTGHWVGFKLRGAPGVAALGAEVTLKSKGGDQVAAIVAGDSFMAQHPRVAHFGLGKTKTVESVQVRWPNGKTTRMAAPAVDRYHVLEAPR